MPATELRKQTDFERRTGRLRGELRRMTTYLGTLGVSLVILGAFPGSPAVAGPGSPAVAGPGSPAVAGPGSPAVVGPGSPVATGRPGPVGLTVTTAKTVYRPDEPPVLTFTLTNQTSTPCQVPVTADGTVQVLSVRRDGAAVAPEFGAAYFADGLEEVQSRRLITLVPTGSVSFPAVLVGGALRASTPKGGGDAIATLWPVADLGTYQLSAVYTAPRLGGRNPALCRGVSDAGAVTFAIRPPPPIPALTRVLIVAGAAVLAGSVARAAWMSRIRRRSRRAGADDGVQPGTGAEPDGAPVITLGIVVLLAAVGLVMDPRPAAAAVTVDAGSDTAFRTTVDGCLSRFQQPGGDPGAIMAGFGSVPVTVQHQVDGQPTTATATTRTATVGLAGSDDLCATLYHELYRLAGFENREVHPGLCGQTGLQVDEVAASMLENRIRAGNGSPARTSVDGSPLPASLDDCAAPPDPPGSRPDCGAGATSGCASSSGDAHLVTFDGQPYDFPAVGEFVAAQDSQTGQVGSGPLEVQVRQQTWPDSRTASVTTAVAVRAGSDRLGFYLVDGVIEVHRNQLVLPLRAGVVPLGGDATLTTELSTPDTPAFQVQWRDGTTLWVDLPGHWSLRVFMTLGHDLRGQVAGVLGNFDDRRADDLTPRGATAPLPIPTLFTDLFRVYADSWRVTPADEQLFEYADGETSQSLTDRTRPEESTVDVPAATRDSASAVCGMLGVRDPTALGGCELDAIVTGQAEFALVAAATAAARGAGRPDDGDRITTLVVSVPGGSATATFAGRSGQIVFVDVVSAALPDACNALTLRGPHGGVLASGCVLQQVGFIDRTVLPGDGQYSVVLDLGPGVTGSVHLRVIMVMDDAHMSSVDGAGSTIAVREPGAVATMTFTGRAGQRITVTAFAATFADQCGLLTLRGPARQPLSRICLRGGTSEANSTVLPSPGTYTVVLDPPAAGTGSLSLRVHT